MAGKRGKTIEEIMFELAAARENVHAWVSEQRRAMGAMHTTEEASTASMQAEVARLQGALQSAGEQGRAVAETRAREKAEVEQLRAQIAEAEGSATTNRAELDRLKRAVESREAEIGSRRAAVASRATGVSAHVGALEAFCAAYSEALGVSFDLHDGALRVTFCLLDPRSPGDRCSFDITGGVTYSVTSCSPRQPDDLERIVSDLNSSADFSSFLCSMRSSFKSMLISK